MSERDRHADIEGPRPGTWRWVTWPWGDRRRRDDRGLHNFTTTPDLVFADPWRSAAKVAGRALIAVPIRLVRRVKIPGAAERPWLGNG